MTKKAYNEIWTSIAVIALFTTVNTALQTQGSELFFSFPSLKDVDRHAATVYGIIITVPLLFLLLRLSILYSKDHGGKKWATHFPVAFNRQVDPITKMGIHYQRFAFAIFFVVPILLQIHLLNVFFSGCLFYNKTSCDYIDPAVYESYKKCKRCISESFTEHLTNLQPFWCSWKNQYAYGSKPGQEVGEVTLFPVYQPWFFLLIEIGLFAYFIYFLYYLFRKAK